MAERLEYLTQEGLRKFENERDFLRKVRRAEIAERLRTIREEGGDLSESAEYEDAKHEQAFVEGRILELDLLLERAVILTEVDSSPSGMIVQRNSRVTVKDEDDQCTTYHIVGRAEANPVSGRISDESPLGRALLGKTVGDRIVIAAPDGNFGFEVLHIGSFS